MHWQDLKREISAKLSDNDALAAGRPILFVDSSQQLLHRIAADPANSRSYTISTAKNGIGNRLESFKTPSGIHQIRHKIGGDQPRGMIFEARQPTGDIACDLDNRQRDEVTSRIMWLDGLEQGVNLLGNCDTFARYIYIHGTSDEQRIGTAVSAGCIRMKNDDVIELFDQVLVNDLVLIR